jgi:hypothetical protein
MKNKLPLLITTCIEVSASGVKLADPAERLALTLEAIAKWLTEPAIQSLVITDGSDYDFSEQVQELNRGPAKDVEFLRFRNDLARVKAQGKGFGEGEIVRYALTNSRILQASEYFAKCTGKLYVQNYAKCLDAFDNDFQCAVNGKREIESLDLRLYFASRRFWLANLGNAHERVNDPARYFLEHSYLDRFREIGHRGLTLAVPPIVVGRSGSDNIQYRPMSLYKYLSRRLRYAIFRRIY